MNKDKILKVLDKYAADYDFPILDSVNFDLAQIRLTVFKDKTQWIIAFEEVGSRGYSIENVIYAYGNCIPEQGLIISMDEHVCLEDDEYWFDEENDRLIVNPFNFKVLIQQKLVEHTATAKDYQEAGINEVEPFSLTKLIRFLSYTDKEKLWLPTQVLLGEIKANKDLSIFYQTESWQHPDLHEIKPSESPFFQEIAIALEQDDVSLIKNTEQNTHWSNYIWSDIDED